MPAGYQRVFQKVRKILSHDDLEGWAFVGIRTGETRFRVHGDWDEGQGWKLASLIRPEELPLISRFGDESYGELARMHPEGMLPGFDKAALIPFAALVSPAFLATA